MKLSDLEDECLFDDIPKLYDPKIKVFITHLQYLEDMIAPKKFPKMFTTITLVNKMKNYFAAKQVKCENFIILKEGKPYEIKLSNGSKIHILMIEAKDFSNNLMVLIKKGSEVSHLYLNMFTQIRTALLNRNFTKWVENGIKDLYLNLKRAEENPEPDELENVLEKIVNTLLSKNHSKIHLCVPLYGYENFLGALTLRLPNLVNLSDEHCKSMGEHLSKLEICYDLSKARVLVIKSFIEDPAPIKMSLTKLDLHDVENLEWSPMPKPYELELITRLVHPDRIYGIINIYTMERKVPEYLWKLTTKAINKHKSPKRKEMPESEMNVSLDFAKPNEKVPDKEQIETNIVRIIKTLNYLDQNSEENSDSS